MDAATKIIPVTLESGSVIRIQARPVESEVNSVVVPVGEEVESDVSLNLRPLREVADSIEEIARTIKTALDKVKPSKASVEFGVEFAVEAGQLTAMIVSGGSTASLKICMEWSDSTAEQE